MDSLQLFPGPKAKTEWPFHGQKEGNRVRNLLFQLHEAKIILENTEQTTK